MNTSEGLRYYGWRRGFFSFGLDGAYTCGALWIDTVASSKRANVVRLQSAIRMKIAIRIPAAFMRLARRVARPVLLGLGETATKQKRAL